VKKPLFYCLDCWRTYGPPSDDLEPGGRRVERTIRLTPGEERVPDEWGCIGCGRPGEQVGWAVPMRRRVRAA